MHQLTRFAMEEPPEIEGEEEEMDVEGDTEETATGEDTDIDMEMEAGDEEMDMEIDGRCSNNKIICGIPINWSTNGNKKNISSSRIFTRF